MRTTDPGLHLRPSDGRNIRKPQPESRYAAALREKRERAEADKTERNDQ